MKRTTFLKKAKKLGLKVEENVQSHRRNYIHHNGTIASWFWQENWQTGELEGTNWHTKGEGQESDPYTDYYPGTFWDNAKQAIDRLSPPPNKFKAGQLVIGKLNKRAKRWGYAGMTALVTKAPSGDQAIMQFVGKDAIEYKSHNNYYPTRDFDLVSG